jgi:hypothetical protein
LKSGNLWRCYLTDFGDAGDDKGKGGKYLLVPPGYKGEIPEGYFVKRSKTYGHWLAMRGFMKDFEPDARMQKIFADAAKVGTAAQRSIIWRNRDKSVVMWPGSKSWEVGFAGGSYAFEHDGVSLIDDRVRFHFYATGITPAMVKPPIGAGSSYVIGLRNAEGTPLDGSKTYKFHIPPNIPAKRFWDITVCDNQIRSLLQTDNPYPGVTSIDKATVKNADGSYDVYIGPKKPDGKVTWIQTNEGRSFFVYLRLYGPEKAYFDQTFPMNKIEKIK